MHPTTRQVMRVSEVVPVSDIIGESLIVDMEASKCTGGLRTAFSKDDCSTCSPTSPTLYGPAIQRAHQLGSGQKRKAN